MTWLFFSILTVGFESSKDVVGKLASHQSGPITTAFFMQLVSGLIFLPYVLLNGIPEIQDGFLPILIVSVFLISSWSIFYTKSIRSTEISTVLPILTINPIIVAGLSFFFDDEIPGLLGWIGIIIILIGLIINRIDLYRSTSIREILTQKGSIYMLIVAFIWAFGAYVGRAGSELSSPLFYTFITSSLAAFPIFIIASIFEPSNLKINLIKKDTRYLIFAGLFNGFSEVSYRTALTMGFVPLVVLIKRLSIVASNYTGWFFFKEKLNYFKIIGSIISVLGVFIYLISSR